MNLTELWSVLTKKPRLELPRAEAIQDEITADVRVVILMLRIRWMAIDCGENGVVSL